MLAGGAQAGGQATVHCTAWLWKRALMTTTASLSAAAAVAATANAAATAVTAAAAAIASASAGAGTGAVQAGGAAAQSVALGGAWMWKASMLGAAMAASVATSAIIFLYNVLMLLIALLQFAGALALTPSTHTQRCAPVSQTAPTPRQAHHCLC